MIRFYDRIIVPFFIYWLVRLLNADEKDLKRLLPLAFILILSQSTIGLLSWFAPQLLPDKWLGRVGERTIGTFGNPAVFTTTLMFCALFLMQAFHEAKSALLRWSALAAVGLAFFMVFFSFSRGSWLGAIAVLIGMAFLYPKTVSRLTLVALLVAGILFLSPPLRSYLGFAGERLTTETTAEGRILGGAATMRLIMEKPLLGWGYHQHEKYDEQFRDRVLDLAVNKQHSSHNTYLLITAEMGVIGLILFLLPTLIWLWRSMSAFKRLPWAGYPGKAILVMLWLLLADHFIAGNFTDLIQSTFFNTGMWWLALGLIANINDSTLPGTTRQRSSNSDLYIAKELTAAPAKVTTAVETPLETEYIFIVGMSRSGTTLMRNILNQSDQIAISRENHFLGHLLGSEGMRHKFRKFGDLHEDANVRRLVDFLYSGGSEKSSWLRRTSAHWRWITRRIDKEVFLQKILESDRSERAMFAAMMDLFAERKGKPIKGEKTPAHFQYADTLLDWFPNAKIIHMMRDPRGIFVSEFRRRQKEAQSFPYKQLQSVPGLMNLYVLLQTTLTWATSARNASENLVKYPGRYTVQRFEDLVRQPGEQVPALCAYLGVPFQQEMLEQEVVSMGFQEKQSGFDAGAADRWKKYIDPFASRWFHFWFGRQLRSYGYDD
jgi:O-antigen ligase